MIRLAARSDITALAHLEQSCFDDASWAPELLLQQHTLVYLETEQVVAAITYRILADVECELLNLAVLPHFRRRGIARILLDQLPNLPTFLEVRESNAQARQLYSSVGFIDTGRRKHYYTHPVEDAILMSRSSVVLQS
jgi:[ribosomal protein S18]-alanine N-acetyltransferase